MNNSTINEVNFFKIACLFESALILVALFLGWVADINPFESIRFTETAVFNGLLGTIPLFLIFAALYQMEIGSLQKIRRILLDTMGSNIHALHWTDLLVLAAIAGISEEVLFRGVIQPWMELSWGMAAGLLGSNVIFGLVHAVTPLYAVLAALVGIYLGLFLDFGGQRNLLTPIIIHGGYDFLAFLVVAHFYRKQNPNSAE